MIYRQKAYLSGQDRTISLLSTLTGLRKNLIRMAVMRIVWRSFQPKTTTGMMNTVTYRNIIYAKCCKYKQGKKRSSIQKDLSGVLQGFVLEPLLYLLFIKGLPLSTEYVFIDMYDTHDTYRENK